MSNSTFFDDVVSFKANFSVTGEIFAQPIKITKNGVYIPPKGYAYAPVGVSVLEEGTEINLSEISVTPTKETQVITPEVVYDGIGQVTVLPIPDEYIIPNLQEKTVTPTKSEQEIVADSGYDSLSKVKVNAIPEEYIIPKLQEKTTTENGNIVADEGYDGLSKVSVNVQPELQEKSINPTTAQQEVTADGEYYGLSKVVVEAIQTETKDITPTKNTQVVTPSESGKYLDEVVVSPIPDEYIVPNGTLPISQNGSHDVTNYASVVVSVKIEEEEIVLQEKTVTPTKSVQEVVADAGYDGLSKAIVNAIPNEYIIPSGELQITENGNYDVTEKSSVSVNVAGEVLETWDGTGVLISPIANFVLADDLLYETSDNYIFEVMEE